MKFILNQAHNGQGGPVDEIYECIADSREKKIHTNPTSDLDSPMTSVYN